MAAMIIQAVATIIAAIAAIFSYLTVKGHRRNARATVLLQCLQAYIDIRRHRTDAGETVSPAQAKNYYRELCDLHWAEFHLFSEGHIAKSVVSAWLDARRRNYQADQIQCIDAAGQATVVRYQDVWHTLVQEHYFAAADPFIRFMNLAHDGDIEGALECKA